MPQLFFDFLAGFAGGILTDASSPIEWSSQVLSRPLEYSQIPQSLVKSSRVPLSLVKSSRVLSSPLKASQGLSSPFISCITE